MIRLTKIISSFVVGGIIGLLFLWIGWTYFQTPMLYLPRESSVPETLLATSTAASHITSTTTTTQLILANATTTPKIQIQTQKAGKTVFINTVVFTKDGWVAVHTQKGKFIGKALGVRYEKSGTQNNISIPLLYPTIKGRTYWIVLYTDNGDGLFNPSDDTVVRSIKGEPIINSFLAT